MTYAIISKREAVRIMLSKEGQSKISLSLGKDEETIEIKEGNAYIRGNIIPLSEFKTCKEDCLYVIDENQLKKAAMFSDETNFYYKLYPTSDWPTLMLSSTPMHRYTHMSPKKDTETKIKEISPVKGVVLDTCCGLGYTAIMSSKYADKVYVFERDPNVIHVASFNPYSQELFGNPKIELKNIDVMDWIGEFTDNMFDRIVHDPPTFKYSPDLYSKAFYKELYRVLKKDGIMYHYAPAPHKTRGEEFHLKIVAGLKAVGFKDVKYSEASSGVVAKK